MTRAKEANGGWADGGRALAYRRVSTRDQTQSGLGLDAQTEAITSTAARLGLVVEVTHDDLGVSGGLALEHRPALLAALEGLRRGDTLIVAKRDRLGRSVLNVAMIERLVERKGARIVSAAGEGCDDDAPTSRLMRQIIDAFSEYERAIIRSRTKAALAALKARGQRCGNLPFGFTATEDGRLIPDPREQAIITRVRDLRAQGMSFRSVAAALNAEGHVTRKNTDFIGSYAWEISVRDAESVPVVE